MMCKARSWDSWGSWGSWTPVPYTRTSGRFVTLSGTFFQLFPTLDDQSIIYYRTKFQRLLQSTGDQEEPDVSFIASDLLADIA